MLPFITPSERSGGRLLAMMECTVHGLAEDRGWRGGAEEALADSLLAVHEQEGRAVLLSLGDGAKQ
ncbi:MAG: hypothetical protein IJJ33_03005 [Victivallales bacterium]|nr:hypothetical protein [Victivallales bacterium]